MALFPTVLAVVIVLILFASFYMYRFACARKSKISSVWEDDALYVVFSKPYEKCGEEIVAKRLALRNAGRHESTRRLTVTSHDGLKLSGRLIPHGGGYASPRGIIAMFHGYRSEPTRDFGTFAMDLRDMGFMLLMVDQRAHGGSEGRHISYGVNERYDAVRWCELLASEYPNLPIILYGLSMGASTVMMASALELPKNVCGVVADCGFTTPAAICRKVLTKDLHLPCFPIYYMSSLMVRIFARFGFDEASAPEALKNATLPVLMYHGTEDKFVPHEMSIENRDACGDKCTFVSIPGAGHGEAYLYDKEGYIKAFREFIRKVGISDK